MHQSSSLKWYYANRERAAATRAAWGALNKERISTYNKRYRAEHRDALTALRVAWGRRNPLRNLVTAARKQARVLGVPFDLAYTDLQMPDVCPVLGIKIERGSGKRCAGSPSLDRIIPALGYVRGNVIVVSWRANKLKSDATAAELRKLADFYGGV